MKVRLQGTNKVVELSNADFLAQGGEGKIFIKGNTAYKLYADPAKMIPEGKFNELSLLSDSHIIKPEDTLFDMKDRRVGFTMRYLKDTYTLCQIFTKAFRVRNNIKPEQVFDLVRQMQQTIHHVHNNGILVVDLNEFNFLLDKDFKEVFFIDVNSYQTPHYPAMAIMDSIHDRHCGGKFTKGSDWFSFAVVSFQMFIGIHPYKGKHPVYTDLDSRMKHNVTIFSKEVGYPVAACQPFSVIPDAYLQWYKAVLEKGERIAPPSDTVALIHVVVPTVKMVGGKTLSIDKLREFDSNVIGYYYSYGKEVIVTSKSIFVDKREYDNKAEKVWVGFTRSNDPVIAWLDNHNVKLYDLKNDKEIEFTCAGEKVMDYDGRLYVQNGMNVLEIMLTEIGNKILASPHVVGNVLEQATKFYPGVVIQNLFDAYYASVFPESKQCQQIALRELDGYRVIDAKYESKILMVVAVDKKGEYNRFTFAFKDWKNYEVAHKKNVTYMGLNFTVLDNGVCVHIDEDENIELFHVDKLSSAKVVTDPAIDNGMMLYHRAATAMFAKDNALYSIAMRKP